MALGVVVALTPSAAALAAPATGSLNVGGLLAPAPAPRTIAAAPAPALSGRIAYDSNRAGAGFEIFTMETDGSGVRQLTSDARFDSWWPQVSPDRTKVLFYRSPLGLHDQPEAFERMSLWVMNIDGSQQVQLRPAGMNGWQVQAQAQWSPTGTQLVMTGGAKLNPQVFVTTSAGQSPRQVTSRPGVNVDPSWSPDGATVAFVGCPTATCYPDDYEIYTIPTSGAATAFRLTFDRLRDQDPAFSPDGGTIAWLTQTAKTAPYGEWNIRRAAVNGANLLYVTSDAKVNSKPEWSRDGTIIWFHRLDPTVWPGFNLYRVRPDATGLTLVTGSHGGSNEYPSV